MVGLLYALAAIFAHAQLAAADGSLLSASAQLHRWANGDDGIKCSIQCNGKNAGHIDGFPESWPLESCWGEFRSECTCDKSETHTVHSIMKCQGAFTTVRHAADDDDDDRSDDTRKSALDAVRNSLHTDLRHHSHDMPGPLEGKNVTFFGCEGLYFNMVKVVPTSSEERDERIIERDSAPEPPADLASLELLSASMETHEHGNKHHHHHHESRRHHHMRPDGDMKGHIMVSSCVGTMHNVVVSPAPMNVTNVASCSDSFMAGKGSKMFPPHATAPDLAAHFTRAESYLSKKALSHARPHGGSSALAGGARAGAAGLSASNVPTEMLGEETDMAGPACATRAGDAPPSPAHCKATCKHKPLSWHGWWPCKGELELDCAGTKEVHDADVCYLLDAKCLGLSWPKFKACTGLYTALFEAAGETEEGKMFGIETLAISNGFRRAKKVSKDGWSGMLEFGKGPSSLRIRGGVDNDSGDDALAEAATIVGDDADAVLGSDEA